MIGGKNVDINSIGHALPPDLINKKLKWEDNSCIAHIR